MSRGRSAERPRITPRPSGFAVAPKSAYGCLHHSLDGPAGLWRIDTEPIATSTVKSRGEKERHVQSVVRRPSFVVRVQAFTITLRPVSRAFGQCRQRELAIRCGC